MSAESRGVRATRRNCITESGGNPTQASHAPLGHTWTGAPLIVRSASPAPTEPSRKLESRASITEPAVGYTTLIASGPRTSGTAGRWPAATGLGAVFDGRAQASTKRPRTTAARARTAVMAARYTDTATYATHLVDAFRVEL